MHFSFSIFHFLRISQFFYAYQCNNIFYNFEIRIIVDEVIPEPDGSLPYVKLRWSSENLIDMDIKPRNFYSINPLLENGSKTLTVQAGIAYAMNSIVTDTTANILGTEYDESRRLTYKIIQNTQQITGNIVFLCNQFSVSLVRDAYNNTRGQLGESQDNVEARVYKNWILLSSQTLTQNSSTFKYEYSFSVSNVDFYQVDILLNGVALDINTFTRPLKYKVTLP